MFLRKSLFLTVVLSLVCVLLSGMAMALSIPGAPNEVVDPYFIQYVDLSVPTWYVTPATGKFTDNPGNLPGYYFDPGRSPGDTGFLRTIVDDYKGLWDPTLKQKEIDLSFFGHIAGDGYIKVRFDWWNDPAIPEPSNNPINQTPPPDGYSPWYTMTTTDLGPFQVRDDLIPAGVDKGWMDHLYNFHEIWDHQPRWVSIEIESGILPNSTIGGEALITGIDFEARCVPEPATWLLLCAALGMFMLFRRKA